MKRKLLWSLAVVVSVVVLLLLAAGWYFSDQIRNGTLKVNRSLRAPDLEVVEVRDDQITLRTLAGIKSTDWKTDGIFGLESPNGYDRVGKIIDLKGATVVREFDKLTGRPRVGDKVRLDHFAFSGDPLQAYGLEFEEVTYNSDAGSFPAWYVAGSEETWAIFVHGRVANRDGRLEALRTLPVATQLGLPSLVISYRNDLGLAENSDGRHWFGLTEWKDVDGAVRYAREHGAKDVVLIGCSMGGGAVANFLYQSTQAEAVKAVVLDAPLLDYEAAIDHVARLTKLPLIGHPPGFVVSIAKVISGIRFGIDYQGLDYLSRADELDVPVLLIHGDADRESPISGSDSLAEARPDIIRYVRVEGADHVRSWNVDPEKYEAAVSDFLTETTK